MVFNLFKSVFLLGVVLAVSYVSAVADTEMVLASFNLAGDGFADAVDLAVAGTVVLDVGVLLDGWQGTAHSDPFRYRNSSVNRVVHTWCAADSWLNLMCRF